MIMEWQWRTASRYAKVLTGRTPRWCDIIDENGEMPAAPTPEAMNDCIALSVRIRDENGEMPAAPTPEAMGDCIALDSNWGQAKISHWMNGVPCGDEVAAVCYF